MWQSRPDMSAWVTHFIHDRNTENDPDWIYGEGEPIRLPYIYDHEKNSRFEEWYNRDEQYIIKPDAEALTVLLKIIDDGHIRSTWAFRGGRPTIYGPRAAVCFTEMPLYALLDYAKQRADKYNVQPYGISILKQDAFRSGARPVVYGLTGNHEEMPRSLHVKKNAIKEWPRFLQQSCGIALHEQYRYVSFNLGEGGYSDWTHEREWRWCDYEDQYSCPGMPLYLDESPNFSNIMIFVPNGEDAQQVLDRLKVHYDSGWDGFGQQLNTQNLLNTRVIALDQVPNRPNLRLEDVPMQYLSVMQHPNPDIKLVKKLEVTLKKVNDAAEAAAASCFKTSRKDNAGRILDVCGFAYLMISEPQSELTAALVQLDAIEPLGRLGYRFKDIKYKRPDQGLCIEEAAMQAAKDVFIKHFPEAQVWIYTRWD
ncbi:MAG: hypothetical protein ACYDHX_08100 [Methanothrix sp.]